MSRVERLIGLLLRKQEAAEEKRLRLAIGLFAVLLASAFQAGLQYTHFFDAYDQFDFDHYARTTSIDPAFSDRITIVAIDDEAYKKLFRSTSPLNQGVVLRLIAAVRKYNPHVIGLDLLTSDWKPLDPAEYNSKTPPIVWARTIGEEVADNNGWDPVGGYGTAPAGLCFASPSLTQDGDGKVRRYELSEKAFEPGFRDATPHATMGALLASTNPDRGLDCNGLPEVTTARLINFVGRGHQIRILRASDVLDDQTEGLQLTKYLSGRIVLIGGTFRQARDAWPSAGAKLNGRLSGVELLAHITESQISGPIRELSFTWSVASAIVFSLLLFWGVSHLRYPFDMALSIVIVSFYTFGLGWILYCYFGVFLPIASSLFSLPIGVLFSHLVECPLSPYCALTHKTNVKQREEQC